MFPSKMILNDLQFHPFSGSIRRVLLCNLQFLDTAIYDIIHVCYIYIYGVPWLPSIYPQSMLALIYQHHGSVMGYVLNRRFGLHLFISFYFQLSQGIDPGERTTETDPCDLCLLRGAHLAALRAALHGWCFWPNRFSEFRRDDAWLKVC